MGGRWNTYGFKLSYLALLIILYDVHGCSSLNSEGNSILFLDCPTGFGVYILIVSSVCYVHLNNGLVYFAKQGLALLGLRSKVDCDPYGVLANWNPDHCDPCMWFGVQCLEGKVQML